MLGPATVRVTGTAIVIEWDDEPGLDADGIPAESLMIPQAQRRIVAPLQKDLPQLLAWARGETDSLEPMPASGAVEPAYQQGPRGYDAAAYGVLASARGRRHEMPGQDVLLALLGVTAARRWWYPNSTGQGMSLPLWEEGEHRVEVAHWLSTRVYAHSASPDAAMLMAGLPAMRRAGARGIVSLCLGGADLLTTRVWAPSPRIRDQALAALTMWLVDTARRGVDALLMRDVIRSVERGRPEPTVTRRMARHLQGKPARTGLPTLLGELAAM